MARSSTRAGAKAPIRGYDNWTVGEMQKKLARRSPHELEALLAYERSARKRKGAIEAIERLLATQADRGGGRGKRSGARKGGTSRRSSGRSKAAETETESGTETVAEKGDSGGTRTMAAEVVAEAVALAEGRELDRAALLDKLSEYLEHERNGVKLYELGLEKIDDEEQRDRLEEFLEQTRRHQEILTAIVTELGGNPDELSPSAVLNREKNMALMEVEGEGEVGRIDYFQNLAISEFLCHANWELLMRCTAAIEDEEVRRVLEEDTSSIEDEEDEHYRWALKQAAQLTVASLFRAPQEARAEALEVTGADAEETEEQEVPEEGEEEEEGEAEEEAEEGEEEEGEDEPEGEGESDAA